MPSTIQLYSQAIRDFKNIQDDLFTSQSKIGADSKAATFAELGSEITILTGFKSGIERSDRFITGINEVSRKLDTSYRAIDEILNIATKFKQDLSLEATTTNTSVNDLTAAVNSYLDRIRGALNTKDGRSFVFAGSKDNEEPVGNLKDVSNIINSTPTANYYRGDSYIAKVAASSTLEIEYGITADDDTFKNLIASLNRAKDEETRGTGANYLQAGEELDNSIEQLISLRAKIGNNLKAMEDMKGFHTQAKSTFEQKYDEANSPDIIELTTNVSQLTATLQASFINFSRISQLSLSNFLG